jgi:hypothetical protein
MSSGMFEMAVRYKAAILASKYSQSARQSKKPDSDRRMRVRVAVFETGVGAEGVLYQRTAA